MISLPPKFFNTAGPCDPEIHYMLPPIARLPQLKTLINQRSYFVIHAPRKTGKTTAMLALAKELTASGQYAAVLVSVESGVLLGNDIHTVERAILQAWREDAEDQLPEALWPPSWPAAEIKAILEPMLAGQPLGNVPPDDMVLGIELKVWRQNRPDPLTVGLGNSREWIMADIIVYHGWGFDRSCWQAWIQRFAADGHRIQAFDRGYFSKVFQGEHKQANGPTFSNHAVGETYKEQAHQRILILHSFGLHLCPIEIIQQSDQVIIFGGFLCFHPEDSRLNRRSKRVVGKMGDRLQTYPLEVLQQFWTNCYAPVSPLTKEELKGVNIPLLHQDLERLNTTTIDETSPLLSALRHIPNMTVIHGEADQIVPLSQGATLADAVSAPLITVPNAGHALPFSHPDQCWALAPFTAW